MASGEQDPVPPDSPDSPEAPASPTSIVQQPAAKAEKFRNPPSPADPKHLEFLAHTFPYSGCVFEEEETRGITLRQLRRVANYVSAHGHTWRSTVNGRLLAADTIDFYQLADWVLKPATEQDDVSFAELVCEDSEKGPGWFLSHWWGESVLGCWQAVEQHVETCYDDLGDEQLTEDTPYWQYAYVARLNDDFRTPLVNPRQASFYKAIQSCSGTLLVMNGMRMRAERNKRNTSCEAPFTRTWCLMEVWATVFGIGKKINFAAYKCEQTFEPEPVPPQSAESSTKKKKSKERRSEDDDDEPPPPNRLAVSCELLTEGLCEEEKRIERIEPGRGVKDKEAREVAFPIDGLEGAMALQIEEALCTEPEDRACILNFFCGKEATAEIDVENSKFKKVNKKLRSTIALAAWLQIVRVERSPSQKVVKALVEDMFRNQIIMNFDYCVKFDDVHMAALSQGFHQKLQMIDLRLRQCSQLSDTGMIALANSLPASLQSLRLDLRDNTKIGNRGVEALADKLPSLVKLTDLYLGFGGCHLISGDGATHLAERLPLDLKALHLDLSGTDRIDDPVCMAIGYRLAFGLRSLALMFQGCHMMTDEALALIAGRLRSLKELQMLRLSFCDCKKMTDEGAIDIGQSIPQKLLLFNIDFENCPVTDEGAIALASRVPDTVTRLAVNLKGTWVSDEKHGVCRKMEVLEQWRDEFVEQNGFPRQVSTASEAPKKKVPVPVKKPSSLEFKLPSVGLRVGGLYGDMPMVNDDSRVGKTWSPALLLGDSSPSNSSSTGSLSATKSRWRSGRRFEDPLGSCRPKWVAASWNASPETMFQRHNSSPELRRPTAHKLSAWKP